MSNMSYCRFENTNADLLDCIRAEMRSRYEGKPSQEEFDESNPRPDEFKDESLEDAAIAWDKTYDSLLSNREKHARDELIRNMAEYLEFVGYSVTKIR